jgi:hypothetical protein
MEIRVLSPLSQVSFSLRWSPLLFSLCMQTSLEGQKSNLHPISHA